MTRAPGAVLIKACLNGGRRHTEHQAIPITTAELASDSARAVAAGAAALHIHPRNSDGLETLDPGVCDSAVAAIRGTCQGVPIGITTIARIEPDPDRRLDRIKRWAVPPDFVSVNFYEPGADALCAWLAERGIDIEAGLVAATDVEALAATGLAARFARILVEAEDATPASALATAAAIDDALDRAGITAPRLYHGLGVATWTVIDAALARGCDIRVGFEDTLVLPDGRRARDNADLVAAAAQLAGQHGLRPVTVT